MDKPVHTHPLTDYACGSSKSAAPSSKAEECSLSYSASSCRIVSFGNENQNTGYLWSNRLVSFNKKLKKKIIKMNNKICASEHKGAHSFAIIESLPLPTPIHFTKNIKNKKKLDSK